MRPQVCTGEKPCWRWVSQTLHRHSEKKSTQQIIYLDPIGIGWGNQSTGQESWSLSGGDGSPHHKSSGCCVFSWASRGSAKCCLAQFLLSGWPQSHLSPQHVHTAVPLTPQVCGKYLLNILPTLRRPSHTTITTDDLPRSLHMAVSAAAGTL